MSTLGAIIDDTIIDTVTIANIANNDIQSAVSPIKSVSPKPAMFTGLGVFLIALAISIYIIETMKNTTSKKMSVFTGLFIGSVILGIISGLFTYRIMFDITNPQIGTLDALLSTPV